MSVDALFWALHQRVERPSDKLTLLCLANYANHDGLAYPSVARLCDDTSLDRKTVLAALKRLADGGWIQDSGKRAGHTKGVVVYRMVPKPAPLSDTETGTASTEAVPDFPTSGPVIPEKQSQKRDTEPVKEPAKEPTEKGAASAKHTWLTPICEAYEQRKGPGTFPFPKAAKTLKPLADAKFTSEEIALRLGRYLDRLDDPRFLSLQRFRETFGDYATNVAPAPTPLARDNGAGEAAQILQGLKELVREGDPIPGRGRSRYIVRADVERAYPPEVVQAYHAIGGSSRIVDTPGDKWGMVIRDFTAALAQARRTSPPSPQEHAHV